MRVTGPFALLAPIALAGLAGCATTSDSGGACRTEPASRFVGQKATAELGWKIQAATGARTLRWVPPRTATTREFNADRVTVNYDDAMIITSAGCG